MATWTADKGVVDLSLRRCGSLRSVAAHASASANISIFQASSLSMRLLMASASAVSRISDSCRTDRNLAWQCFIKRPEYIHGQCQMQIFKAVWTYIVEWEPGWQYLHYHSIRRCQQQRNRRSLCLRKQLFYHHPTSRFYCRCSDAVGDEH